METHVPSLAHEITRVRHKLQISQMRLARLMNLKTHRLSDLEKARSIPSEPEANRLRRLLYQLVQEHSPQSPTLAPLRSDPRLQALIRGRTH